MERFVSVWGGVRVFRIGWLALKRMIVVGVGEVVEGMRRSCCCFECCFLSVGFRS
jgi:hypothetical protein